MNSVPAGLWAQGFSWALPRWYRTAPALLRGRPPGRSEQSLLLHSLAPNWMGPGMALAAPQAAWESPVVAFTPRL